MFISTSNVLRMFQKRRFMLAQKSPILRRFWLFTNMKQTLLLISIFILSLSYSVYGGREYTDTASSRVFRRISRPKIVSRKKWKAENAIGKGKEHTISHITIHHTATLQNEKLTIEKKMQNLQNFSQSPGRLASGKSKPAWFDVPYHYYIAVDGKIAEGRKIKFVGDTNTEYDPDGHALIVVEGNFQTEQPSPKQRESLQKLVAWLSFKWKVSTTEIKAHNDYAATACPGENLKKLLPLLRQKTSEMKRAPDRRR